MIRINITKNFTLNIGTEKGSNIMRNVITTWFTRLFVVAISVASFAPPATAEYPEKPIKIIVPYSAGGGTDTFARRLEAQLVPKLGQEIVIKNIAGAGGTKGMKAAAEARGFAAVMSTRMVQ